MTQPGGAQRGKGWRVDVAPLAGSLVHEIKNPLSTLHINAQLLLEDWKDAREPRELRTVKRLKVMLAEVQRLEGIVQAFLRFTEKHELLLRESSLNEVVEELIELIGPEARKRGVQLRTRLDPALEPFPFDRDLLKQVLLNLLLNGQQAMEPKGGGELMVFTRREEGTEGRWAVVDVIDTGVGISERARERIFDLYFSTKPSGMGLGLAISRRIIDEHGGSIGVQSEEGKGSQFTLRLPLDIVAERGGAEGGASRQEEGQGAGGHVRRARGRAPA